jgi:hypothetical protein
MFRRLTQKLSLLSMALFVFASCGPKLEPQKACNFVQNSQIQRVSWKGQVPVTMFIHESVPENLRGALLSAMSKWEYSVGKMLFKYGGVKNGPANAQKDNESVIYYFKDYWNPEKPSEQGRTTIYWAGDKITEADILINAKNFDYFTTSEYEVWSADRTGTYKREWEQFLLKRPVNFESLLVHELGHVLGLGHIYKADSVMAETLEGGTLRVDPKEIDKDSLSCEY